ncbi:hypothetical protein P154DRAFT_532423 [Amniculicola lignicola CBS 123094]|uniref:GPI anchored protein n=1 Tax=Amniculicola lignicola CBS 123094 TaxID=1392246 RepID=A0A6A5WMW9_9PLEO|nr:hypothetical protein P154DRAFT_532423 [Amniculicola lignicola CBS 123094]
MRTSIFISAPIFAAAAFAQDSSSTVDAFPQTSYLQQTNSLGVVTGMPAVFTSQPSQPAVFTSQPSQPAVVTSQPEVATIPAIGTTGLVTIIIPGVNTTITHVYSGSNSTTVEIINTPTPSVTTTMSGGASGSGASGTGADATGSGATGGASSTSSQGAAATMHAVAGSVVGLGAFMAAFL